MPDWKAIEKKRNDNSPTAIRRRANTSIKQALLNAFDTLGNEAFFVDLGRGSAEDRRCLAQILAKLLPIEVAGSLDASLTVKVITMVGDHEIDITPKKLVPKTRAAAAAPLSAPLQYAPEEVDA